MARRFQKKSKSGISGVKIIADRSDKCIHIYSR